MEPRFIKFQESGADLFCNPHSVATIKPAHDATGARIAGKSDVVLVNGLQHRVDGEAIDVVKLLEKPV